MKHFVIFSLFFLIAIPFTAGADDNTFATTSDDILRQMNQKPSYSATRSFIPVADEEKRAIVVRTKENDTEVLVSESTVTEGARLKVEFDVNSSRLRADSYKILDQLGIALGDVSISGRQVCIKGHTDSDGAEKYNLGLSYDRAEAVKEYVRSQYNITDVELFVVGYGEQVPLVTNDSPQHKQMNRRVEVTLGCSEVMAAKKEL